MDQKISIIIPVYNVEKYLEQCLESVINQDYDSMEVILIDDGSSDSSGKICDQYALRDNRVIVIHQENNGAGAAKNIGLNIASGEYLSFVDADDFLEPNVYTYMVNKMEKYKADVIQCTFNDFYIDKKEHYKIIDKSNLLKAEDYLKRYTYDWTSGLLWDKLYKRKIFQNIFFEKGHIIDDEYFTYRGIMNANLILQDEFLIYNYRKRKTGVTSIKENQKRTIIDRLDFIVKRRNNIISKYPNLKKEFDLHLVNMLIWLSKDYYADSETIYMVKKIISNLFNEKIYNFISKGLIVHLLILRFFPTKLLLCFRRNENKLDFQDNYFD